MDFLVLSSQVGPTPVTKVRHLYRKLVRSNVYVTVNGNAGTALPTDVLILFYFSIHRNYLSFELNLLIQG